MVFVKRPLVVIHVRIAVPGFRDHHGHGVGQGTAGLHEEFERIVERCGIAAIRLDNGEKLGQVSTQQFGLQHRLARMHPVDIAFDRIDFAVVGHIVERVGEVPGGECVGGKALVDQTQGAGDIGIGEFAVKLRDLRRQQQTFIDNRARGERRDAEHAAIRHV